MTTVLLVAFLVLIFSLQSLFCKLFSEHYSNSNAGMTSTVFSISYGAFAGIATLIVARGHFAPSAATLLYGSLNAVVLLLYNTAMIQASRTGSYSMQMLCMLFGAIVVPLVHEALWMGGSFTGIQLLAIGLMLVSFVLMNWKGLALRGNSRRFLLWCAVLFFSNGFYSVLLNVQQTALGGAERNEMVILTYLGMALLYTVFQLFRDRRALAQSFRMHRRPLLDLLLCCICATVASHLVLYVLSFVDATILYTIDNGGVLVLSVLYSCLLFHEKLSRLQISGILLAAVSIILLSL